MTTRQHCLNIDGCLAHDHGVCRHCGVRLKRDRVAMSFDGHIWLCESCYSNVRDAVDAALDDMS